jgi:hypothetical protein
MKADFLLWEPNDPGQSDPKMEMEPCSLAGLNGDPYYAIRQNQNTKLENQQKVSMCFGMHANVILGTASFGCC